MAAMKRSLGLAGLMAAAILSHFPRACNWRMFSLDIFIIRLLTAVAEATA
jgi:hypothetical protein